MKKFKTKIILMALLFGVSLNFLMINGHAIENATGYLNTTNGKNALFYYSNNSKLYNPILSIGFSAINDSFEDIALYCHLRFSNYDLSKIIEYEISIRYGEIAETIEYRNMGNTLLVNHTKIIDDSFDMINIDITESLRNAEIYTGSVFFYYFENMTASLSDYLYDYMNTNVTLDSGTLTKVDFETYIESQYFLGIMYFFDDNFKMTSLNISFTIFSEEQSTLNILLITITVGSIGAAIIPIYRRRMRRKSTI